MLTDPVFTSESKRPRAKLQLNFREEVGVIMDIERTTRVQAEDPTYHIGFRTQIISDKGTRYAY